MCIHRAKYYSVILFLNVTNKISQWLSLIPSSMTITISQFQHLKIQFGYKVSLLLILYTEKNLKDVSNLGFLANSYTQVFWSINICRSYILQF